MTLNNYPPFFVAEVLSKKRLLMGSEVFEAYKFFAEVVRNSEGFIGPGEFVSLVRDNWDSIKERFPPSILETIDEPEQNIDDLENPFNLSSEELCSNPKNPNSYGIDSFIAPAMLLLWVNNPRISHDNNSDGVSL